MSQGTDRRCEKRLRYNWPVWFAENYDGILSQGQMVDVSSMGAAFTCYADKCPPRGGHITARFSVPRYGSDDSFDLENFIRGGYICRVDELSPFIRRIAIQFHEPLPFKPGEIADSEALAVDTTIDTNSEFLESEAAAMAEDVMPIETAEGVRI